MPPPGSPCSIIFGDGITAATAGSLDSLVLVVDDIEKCRAELVDRGVDVSEVFHDAGGVFHHSGTVAPKGDADDVRFRQRPGVRPAAIRRKAHGEHEKRIGQPDPDWPDWYAEYMVREQAGDPLHT